MIYERLILMRDLMHSDGSIYVHMGPNVSPAIETVIREVFGSTGASAMITWKRVTAHGDSQRWGVIHDSILWRTKGESYIWNPQYEPYDESYLGSKYTNTTADGRRYRLDNLTSPNPRPNMMYEWRGCSPPAMGWRYELATMEKLFAEGRIELPKKEGGRPQLRRFLDEGKGVPVGTVWADLSPVNSQAKEDTGYSTQKPELLVERILKASSNEGDLVADFFCGSGTTAAVAEKLGRKWIATDLGKFGIHTTRKRLIQVQRELKAGGQPFRAFEVLNLGRYERQAYLNVAGRLTGKKKDWAIARKEQEFRDLILKAYRAEPLGGGGWSAAETPAGQGAPDAPSASSPRDAGAGRGLRRGASEKNAPPLPSPLLHSSVMEERENRRRSHDEFFHGKTGGRLVVVGPINLPVGRLFIEEVIMECRKRGASRVDVLAFEFEMGLFPAVLDEAKQKGIDLAPKTIPPEVFDKRAVEKGRCASTTWPTSRSRRDLVAADVSPRKLLRGKISAD